jgi:tRNA dimethylallyltransferase
MSLMNQIACIAGPTASGKSAMAIKLAQAVGGEVINADALQVYSGLRILSARPSAAEEASVPHHLFGHIDPSVRYSVGHWLREVEPVIIDVLARGRVPIVIGGTGLYFKALTQGLAKVHAPSEARKQQAAAERLDPIAFARILGNDPQRLLRLTEVALGTGKPLSAWQADTRPVVPPEFWQGIVLLPEREALYGRINARFDQMASNGGMEEAARIATLGLDPMLPAMKAIGLRELIAVNSGDMELEQGLERAKRETRRFAKRQYTWFRGQAKDWPVAVTNAERESFAAMLRKV